MHGKAPCVAKWARVSRKPREHPPLMSSTWLAGLAFCCAAVPAVLWVWNMLLYREPGAGAVQKSATAFLPDAISVLDPAPAIEDASSPHSLTSLLASRGVRSRSSCSMTPPPIARRKSYSASPQRIRAYASNIRLRSARLNGNNTPATRWRPRLASNVLCFLDAHVRLAPEALVRMAASWRAPAPSGQRPFQGAKSPLDDSAAADPLCVVSLLALADMRAFSAAGFRRTAATPHGASDAYRRPAATRRSRRRCMTGCCCRSFFTATSATHISPT